MKFLKSKVFGIIILMMIFGLYYEMPKDSDLVVFSDENIEAVIRARIGVSSGDIHRGDLKDIVVLDLSHLEISDLNGIENIVNVEDFVS